MRKYGANIMTKAFEINRHSLAREASFFARKSAESYTTKLKIYFQSTTRKGKRVRMKEEIKLCFIFILERV